MGAGSLFPVTSRRHEHTPGRPPAWLFVVGLLNASPAIFAGAQTGDASAYQVLHSFAMDEAQGTARGAFPEAPLLLGTDGFFYGTTGGGGASGAGSIFRVDASGRIRVLHTFANAARPLGRLIQAADGSFYGTTVSAGGPEGGDTIFKFDAAGALTPLHAFNPYVDGAGPRAGLTQGSDGGFYGTTWTGGADGNGTVFRMDAAGDVTVLHAFRYDGSEGTHSWSTLLEGRDGNFYGTTSTGGVSGGGTIFRITPGGQATVMHAFDPDAEGSRPMGGLALGRDGNFYGTTLLSARSSPGGTIYKISRAGIFAVVHDFSGQTDEGSGPVGDLIQASDGTLLGDGSLYGVNHTSGPQGGGTVYRLDSSGAVRVLHTFGNDSSGASPLAGLIQGADFALYGTAAGSASAPGVVFRLSLGIATWAPSITSANGTVFTVATSGTFIVTTSGRPTVATISERGSLPSGVTFTDNGNGTATISGTPDPGTGGTYRFFIVASSSVQPNASQSFALTVKGGS